LSAGERIAGRYRISRFIARGAMGEVYEAEDLELGRPVALKVLRPRIARDELAIERFRREIRLASKVTHPNVCRLLDHGTHRPQPASEGAAAEEVLFLTMELLRGETLSDRLRRTGRIPEAEALPLIRQMAEALAAAHGAGVVHRDFKPGNVLLAPSEQGLRAVVTDFGLARASLLDESLGPSLTATGAIVGTPAYMAPEQVEDGPISAATDIYAFGVVLYEMLTGALPFAGETALATAIQRLKQDPPRPRQHAPELDPGWEAAILRCLERAPQDRFASALDVLRALSGEKVAAGPRRRRRSRHRLALGLTAAALLLLGAGWSLRFGRAMLSDLATAELGTGELVAGRLQVRRLTSTAEREVEGSFSPDGKSLVLAVHQPGEGQYDLVLAPVSGGPPRRLTRTPETEFGPRFSPDGGSIAFSRAEAGGAAVAVFSLLLAGGKERRMAQEASLPAWSPDGRELAFVRHRAGDAWSIVRRSLLADAERVIGSWGSPIESLDWSPDGESLAFTDGRSLQVLPAQGGAPRQLARGGSLISAAWAPSGTALFCDLTQSGLSNIWRVPLDGTRPVPITAGGEGWGARSPAVSRDGRKLLYTHEQKQWQLWSVDASGKNPRRLPSQTTIECFDVDRLGERLAVLDLAAGPGESPVGVLDLQTLQRRSVGDGSCPAFSADGRRLAFLRWDPGEEGLWSFDLETGRGQRIDTTSGEMKTLEGRRPDWAPDGERIVYPGVSAAGDGLTIVELRRGRKRLLAPGSFGNPAWSPDGRWIAASSRRQGASGLYLFEAATGAARRLSAESSYKAAPVWAKDGRSLQVLVEESREPRLLTVRLDGQEPAAPVVLEIQAGPGFWGVFDIRAVPGKGWIYLLERYEGDLYLIEPPAEVPGRSP
jgi:Tol biopolymer transport system component/tRNA A-37 threonylcarbamoyl transferase component Bud32